MNTRDELLEVMARAANLNAPHWRQHYDSWELAVKAGCSVSDYNTAERKRSHDVYAQSRALEAIEAKGALVTRTGITDEMLIVFIYSLQKLHPGLVKLHYDKETLKLAINETIAASPFAPEKRS